MPAHKLTIDIPAFFELDAGTTTEGGDRYIITPPAVPMLDQLVAHLDSMPLQYGDIQTKHLGVGLAALCVRSGSYLATLVDASSEPHRAVADQSPARPNHFSMITDAEMMRMNIEVSYNIARLAQLYRERRRYGFYDLLIKAHQVLPMPQKSVPRNHEATQRIGGALLEGNVAIGGVTLDAIRSLADADELATILALREVQAVPVEHADRSLANTLACHSWRNTQIESIHAGLTPEPHLLPHQQRLTSREQRGVMREIAANFGAVFYLWDELFDEEFHDNLLPTWPATARAMANSAYAAWASSNWSLIDTSSVVTLYK